MEDLGYYNGTYGPIETMTVPMNDRACYFGDGLYEVVYTRNHIPYALEEHMDRLYDSAAKIGIRIPLTRIEFSQLIRALIQKVDAHEQMVYWQVSRGTEMRSHAPARPLMANVWVTIRPMRLRELSTPMRLITVEDTRFSHCNMKTLNLLPSVLASQRAVAAGVDEAVFVRDGRITECAHSNLSVLRGDGVLQTAPADQYILAGVARAHLLALCRSWGIPVLEKPFTRAQMLGADEILVTASGTLCRGVCQVDGIPVGGKAPKLLSSLQNALMRDFLDSTQP